MLVGMKIVKVVVMRGMITAEGVVDTGLEVAFVMDMLDWMRMRMRRRMVTLVVGRDIRQGMEW